MCEGQAGLRAKRSVILRRLKERRIDEIPKTLVYLAPFRVIFDPLVVETPWQSIEQHIYSPS